MAPVRTFYGQPEGTIRTELGQLLMTYQKALGNDRIEVISTGDKSHRGPLAKAVPQWKGWCDELRTASTVQKPEAALRQ